MNHMFAFRNGRVTDPLQPWLGARESAVADPCERHDSPRAPSGASPTRECFCSDWFAQRRWEDDGGDLNRPRSPGRDQLLTNA
jgi:hypothetical protein